MLLTALSLSLAITGLYVAFQWYGMILRPVKNLLDSHLPPALTMPLYNCPICMASVYTSLYYIAEGHTTLSVFDGCWLLLMVAGINVFICILLNKTTDHGC